MFPSPPHTILGSIVLYLLIAPTSSQNTQLLDFTSPNALPPCANQCQPLYSAQYACIPPQAPVTDEATYRSCFCQSGFLRNLYSTTIGLCDAACSVDDLTRLRDWYLRSCAAQRSFPTASTIGTSSSSVGSTSTASATSGGQGPTRTSPSVVGTGQPLRKNWWSGHWKWVLMVIILALGIIGAAVGGVMLKRYLKKKRTAAAVEPVMWGPHQQQHFTRGYTYDSGGSGEGVTRSVPKGNPMSTINKVSTHA